MHKGTVWDNSKWYHLAAVHGAGDGSMQRIYVDGELFIEQQRMGSISWDSHMLVFGARHHNNSFGWHSNTYLDDVRFYNRALSSAEVQVQAGAFLNKIVGSYGAAFSYQVQANRGPDAYQVTTRAPFPQDLLLMVQLELSVAPRVQLVTLPLQSRLATHPGMIQRLYFRINRGSQTLNIWT